VFKDNRYVEGGAAQAVELVHQRRLGMTKTLHRSDLHWNSERRNVQTRKSDRMLTRWKKSSKEFVRALRIGS
jgi:hypothetical protein